MFTWALVLAFAHGGAAIAPFGKGALSEDMCKVEATRAVKYEARVVNAFCVRTPT